MQMVRRHVEKGAGAQCLPGSIEHERAASRDNMDEGAPTTGVFREFLSVGKREKDHSQRGGCQYGATDNARFCKLHKGIKVDDL